MPAVISAGSLPPRAVSQARNRCSAASFAAPVGQGTIPNWHASSPPAAIRAKRWAAQILECSPLAVRASKQCVYAGLDEPTLETAITTMYPSQQRNRDSQDYIEGPKAFAEKRKPNWKNR